MPSKFNIFNLQPMTNNPGPFSDLPPVIANEKRDAERLIDNLIGPHYLDLQRDKVTPPKRKGDDKRNGRVK